MNRQRQAYAFGLLAVLMWSTVASAFKLSLRYLEPAQLLFYANLVSVLVLLAIVVARGKFARVLGSTRRELVHSLILGALNPCLYYLILFQAYERLPAQEAQPLNYTWAITLALLSVPLLKQRLTRWDLVALGVSYTGVVVIATGGDPLALQFSDPLGVALALASTVVWALYWIYKTRDRRDPVVALFLSFLLALPLVGAVVGMVSEFAVADWRGLAGAAYVGVFEMGIAFVVWLYALRLSDHTAGLANLIFLSPFLSLLLIHLLVGEVIRGSTLIGLVLIVAGNLVQPLRRPPAG